MGEAIVRSARTLAHGLVAGAWIGRASALVWGSLAGFALVHGDLTWCALFSAFALAWLLAAWRLDDHARALSRLAAATLSVDAGPPGTNRS